MAKGFQASLICTVSALNIRHIARMSALAAFLGIKRFFLQVIGLRGKSAAGAASAGGSWQVQPEDWFATVPPVAMDAAARGLFNYFLRFFFTFRITSYIEFNLRFCSARSHCKP